MQPVAVHRVPRDAAGRRGKNSSASDDESFSECLSIPEQETDNVTRRNANQSVTT